MIKGFKFIGISIRTTNKNNKAKIDLEKLWKQFFSDNLFQLIPNKISNDILTIYTDYKSNYTEEYTAIIGVKVSSLEEIPNGLIGREFEADKFKIFTAKGQMPSAVVNSWIEIWANDDLLNRKYSYDYEIYGDKSQNGDNSEVEIYISIK